MNASRGLHVVLALLVFAACCTRSTAAELPLKRVADLRLPGNATRLDYQSFDPHKHLLFIAHLGDSEIIVVNTGRVMKEWSIGSEPDVLALDPATHTLYVAAESGIVSMFSDGASVVRIAQAYLAAGAHTVAVDPLTHLVYFPLENIRGAPVLWVMRTRR